MNDFEFKKLNINSPILEKEETINMKRKISQIKKTARENAKLEKCYYCGIDEPQFCLSHSVPRFVLQNLSKNGSILSFNALIELPFEQDEKGIGVTGTFKMICKKCDSKIFSDYENPENYLNNITPKMLAEIALKNNLKSISKRLIEIEINNQAFLVAKDYFKITEIIQKQEINKIDLREYENAYRRTKNVLKKGWDSDYYLIYTTKLDYVVPIAFQSNLALVCGLDGNIINDIYLNDEKYKIQYIQLSIFPLTNESIIILFMDSKNKRYSNFNKQFKKLSDSEKLEVLNYIMFLYSEDIYMSPTVKDLAKKSNELVEIAKCTSDINCYSNNDDYRSHANYKSFLEEHYNLTKRKLIPNFLSKENALIRLKFKNYN